MLEIIRTVWMGVSFATILTVLVTSVPLRLPGRLVLAGAAGAWAGFAGAVAASGALAHPAMVPVMFATPIIVMAALVLFFPSVRRIVDAIPLHLLVGLNILRVGGILFVLLAFAGRLSGPFPYIAGLGDFATGLWAISVARLAAREAGLSDRPIFTWNLLGMADLIVAVALGVTSSNGSPLQLIHAGVGSAAMQTLPFAFVPTVLVPFFLVVHGVIFARLRAYRRAQSGDMAPVESLRHAH